MFYKMIMVRVYTGINFLTNLTFVLFKIPYRICESAYSTLCSFFVAEKSVHDEIVLVCTKCMMFDITGAGHGMGRELALQYARLGATVVCLDINQQTNENTANEIAKITERSVYTYQCDVSVNVQVHEIAEKVKREVGDVTILINNAGIMPCQTLFSQTTDQITSQFNINVLSHFWMIKAFLPAMIKNNHGHIVAMSSIAGLSGFPFVTTYTATKFAIRGLMEALEEELRVITNGKSSIKFTTIFPYMVNTGLCKKPKIRYSGIFSLTSPKEAVTEIIRAQRRQIIERSIPSFWLPFINLARILPKSLHVDIRDFIDSGVEPENISCRDLEDSWNEKPC